MSKLGGLPSFAEVAGTTVRIKAAERAIFDVVNMVVSPVQEVSRQSHGH
jgi:hypothetical protein